MDFRLSQPGAFAFGMAWRILAGAGMALGLAWVLMTTHYYATAVMLAGAIALLLLDATQRYARLAARALPDDRIENRARARRLDQVTALLDAVTVALIATDNEGRITFSNRAARLLAGKDVGTLGDINALGPDAVTTIQSLPVGGRQIITMADGRAMLVWVNGFASPGQPAQNLISLQAVVGELDAVQLRAWQDMTRVLSHEIMNSLTPIASLSESLARLLQGASPCANASAQEMAAARQTTVRRSNGLLHFVRRYRRITELPAPSISRIALTPFLADIDALMGARLAARGIAYRGPSPAPAIGLDGDAQLLSQALINLLHNAADAAAAAQTPRVALSCLFEETEIVFAIRDNGAGIPEKQRQEIFVPFFTTKPGGHGIGLTLARQIVLAHGGQITLRDDPAGGTVFEIRLPQQFD